jgi:hypothetical protein
LSTPAEVLERGDIEVLGLLPFSSNYVFLTAVRFGSDEVKAVYKPRRGERPLWDFPHETLAAREVAAFLISDALGWDLVPPTVMRMDAELGPGSFQLFIDHDPNRHYFVLMHERGPEMARFAAFDVVINNADRKGGHIVEGPDGHLWGVDHGLSFNVEPKLRTVIWAFAEEPLGEDLRPGLVHLQEALGVETELTGRLEGLLTPDEIAETRARLELLLKTGRFPAPEGRFSMPWPLV